MDTFLYYSYTQKIGAYRFVKNSSKSCQNDKISTSFDGHIDEEGSRFVGAKNGNLKVYIVVNLTPF